MLKMALKKKDTDKDTFQGMTVHGSEVLPWDTVTAPPRRSISLVRMQIQDKNSCFIFSTQRKKMETHKANSCLRAKINGTSSALIQILYFKHFPNMV